MYSTESPLKKRIAKDSNFLDRARSFGISGTSVDGNDVSQVYEMSQQLQSEIRKGMGPRILECSTYRWREHVGPLFDWEAGRAYRSKEEIQEWMLRCPLAKLRNELVNSGFFTNQELKRRETEISITIEGEYSTAQSDAFPPAQSAKSGVFASELELI